MKKLFILLQFVSIAAFSQATLLEPYAISIPKVTANPTCNVAAKGKQIFNTTSNKMFYCNGSSWIDLSGLELTLPYTATGSNPNYLLSINNTGQGKALKTNGGLQMTGVGEGMGKVLTSDASGNATWQGAVAFSATYGGESNLTVGQSAEITIPFSTETYDLNNNFSNTSFTAPVSGIYHLDATITWTGFSPANGYGRLSLFKNDEAVYGEYQAGQQNAFSQHLSLDIKLFTNDVVKLKVFQSSTSEQALTNTGLFGSTGNYMYFSGHLLTRQ
ncbi:C1q-like domain-containing protein [Emticicia sp. C21]|uniref:C1q-like domain-containing protein n=1 Tax=Emticicia sp. C21 TaxID=2302915 RepID=UPI000E34AC3C|nr:hypothetical protein [Emticicia sp. C21]RFS16064.1 hypothetical protein D0T08_14335 [Emticicia sp. C21]